MCILSDSLRGHVVFLNTLSILSNSLTGRQRKALLSQDGESELIASLLENVFSKCLEKLMSEYESERIHMESSFVDFR